MSNTGIVALCVYLIITTIFGAFGAAMAYEMGSMHGYFADVVVDAGVCTTLPGGAQSCVTYVEMTTDRPVGAEGDTLRVVWK
jgi:hypothetical protein